MNTNEIPWAEGTLFVDIPSAVFKSLNNPAIKVIAWFKGEGDATTVFTEKSIDVSQLRYESPSVSLSVTNDPVENAILNTLIGMEAFVVQGTGWRRTIASDYHLGGGLFAIDLNKGGGADDGNEAVYTTVEGIVDTISFDPATGKSTLKIRHELDRDGDGIKEIIWYTKYLHMDKMGTFDINGNQIGSLSQGMRLNAGQRIGEVGDVGSPGNVHLHLEILKSDGSLIDARNLLAHNDIQTKAWDPAGGGELLVEWDASLNAWKGNEPKNTGLVFVTDANQYSGGESNVWVAWDVDSTERSRVKWDGITSTWYAIDNNGNIITNAEGKRKVWLKNSLTTNYEFVWQ